MMNFVKIGNSIYNKAIAAERRGELDLAIDLYRRAVVFDSVAAWKRLSKLERKMTSQQNPAAPKPQKEPSVEDREAAAAKLFDDMLKRARSGDLEAAFKIGKRYSIGIGVKRDLQMALRWLYYAYDQGYEKASGQIEFIERTNKIRYDGAREGLPGEPEIPKMEKPPTPPVPFAAGLKLAEQPIPKKDSAIPAARETPAEIEELIDPSLGGVEPKPNEVKIKPPQQPNARFKIWHVPEFEKGF